MVSPLVRRELEIERWRGWSGPKGGIFRQRCCMACRPQKEGGGNRYRDDLQHAQPERTHISIWHNRIQPIAFAARVIGAPSVRLGSIVSRAAHRPRFSPSSSSSGSKRLFRRSNVWRTMRRLPPSRFALRFSTRFHASSSGHASRYSRVVTLEQEPLLSCDRAVAAAKNSDQERRRCRVRDIESTPFRSVRTHVDRISGIDRLVDLFRRAAPSIRHG